MVGLIDGSNEAIYGPDEFVGGEMSGGKWMRQGDMKAVLVPEPYGTGEWRLFDVVKDPGEAEDLSEEMPDKLKSLIASPSNARLVEPGLIRKAPSRTAET